MNNTPNLGLPYLSESQYQKEVKHNEALNIIDVLVQGRVKDKDIGDPPAAVEGDRYIVASGSALGAWAGKENNIAYYIGGAWKFIVPKLGFLFYVEDEDKYYSYKGVTGWQASTI